MPTWLRSANLRSAGLHSARPVPRPQRNLPGAQPKIHDLQAPLPHHLLRQPPTSLHDPVRGDMAAFAAEATYSYRRIRSSAYDARNAHPGQNVPVVARLTQPAYLTAQKLVWTLNLESARLSVRAKDVNVIKVSSSYRRIR
ncbi:hypothetical protein MTO96_026000 [Rhipicephalus appendiculatus]